MDDITELQRRIEGALDRIGAGLDRLTDDAGPATGPEVASDDHSAELEAERRRGREMAEQLQASRDHCVAVEARAADLQAELDQARARLAEMERDCAELRSANDHLLATSETLRHAASDHAMETHQINEALAAEVEALKAVRCSDRSELDAIVGLIAAAIETDEQTEEQSHV